MLGQLPQNFQAAPLSPNHRHAPDQQAGRTRLAGQCVSQGHPDGQRRAGRGREDRGGPRTPHSPSLSGARASSGPAPTQLTDELTASLWTLSPPLPPEGPAAALGAGSSVTVSAGSFMAAAASAPRARHGGLALWREDGVVSSDDLSGKTGPRDQHGCGCQSWGREKRTPPSVPGGRTWPGRGTSRRRGVTGAPRTQPRACGGTTLRARLLRLDVRVRTSWGQGAGCPVTHRGTVLGHEPPGDSSFPSGRPSGSGRPGPQPSWDS